MEVNCVSDLDEMLTINDVCQHLRIERKKAYRLCKLDSFPAIKVGKSYVIPKGLYLKWLKAYVGKEILL